MIPKRPKPEENVDSWLMSYADMITLLLCFFIIFVSVSEPKKDKISEIAEGMSGKFGAVSYDTPFSASMRMVQASVEKYKLYRDVAVESRTSGLSMDLATKRFFKQGGADIDEETLPVLNELIESLKQSAATDYVITIESHTDNTPPQSGIFHTNWELSAVRAAKIAGYFVTQGFDPKHIRAVGYGDSRPRVPNMDAKGQPIEENRARNQRVTIRMEQGS